MGVLQFALPFTHHGRLNSKEVETELQAAMALLQPAEEEATGGNKRPTSVHDDLLIKIGWIAARNELPDIATEIADRCKHPTSSPPPTDTSVTVGQHNPSPCLHACTAATCAACSR